MSRHSAWLASKRFGWIFNRIHCGNFLKDWRDSVVFSFRFSLRSSTFSLNIKCVQYRAINPRVPNHGHFILFWVRSLYPRFYTLCALCDDLQEFESLWPIPNFAPPPPPHFSEITLTWTNLQSWAHATTLATIWHRFQDTAKYWIKTLWYFKVSHICTID